MIITYWTGPLSIGLSLGLSIGLTSKHQELGFLDFDKKYQKMFVMVPL
jgi:hypothetical protein